MTTGKAKVGIVGSGLIGRSWAMLFVSAGYQVTLYDVSMDQIQTALKDIREQMKTLEKNCLLRGSLSADEQFSLIKVTNKLEECLKDAFYIQECVPEELELKREVLRSIDKFADLETIIASSVATYVPSLISDHLKNKNNFIVAHPVNPPYYIPLVEIVPAPWTDKSVIIKTKEIMNDIGQSPIVLQVEIPGYALNRIQFVILNECWHLVKDGVLTVEDADKVMTEGLGMRYAFIGPLETAHLNADGMENYCEKYTSSTYEVCETLKPIPKFEGPQVKELAEQLCNKTPLNKLKERRHWRDICMTHLSVLKSKLRNNNL